MCVGGSKVTGGGGSKVTLLVVFSGVNVFSLEGGQANLGDESRSQPHCPDT